MGSMNPNAPGFVDASAAAARYANFVNEPKYQVANAYFNKLDKEKEAEELRAEGLRRYNQEFGLKGHQPTERNLSLIGKLILTRLLSTFRTR